MNSNTVILNGIRLLLLWLLQVFILKSIALGWRGSVYIYVVLYPLFIMLLPLRTPRALSLFLAFVLGLAVDVFYDSPGLHASASVFTAYMRPYVLYWIKPREGYNVNHSPTKARFGFSWFWRYAAIMLAFHLLCYFSMMDFSIAYLSSIALKTVFSFIASFAFILMVMFIFNPVD